VVLLFFFRSLEHGLFFLKLNLRSWWCTEVIWNVLWNAGLFSDCLLNSWCEFCCRRFVLDVSNVLTILSLMWFLVWIFFVAELDRLKVLSRFWWFFLLSMCLFWCWESQSGCNFVFFDVKWFFDGPTVLDTKLMYPLDFFLMLVVPDWCIWCWLDAWLSWFTRSFVSLISQCWSCRKFFLVIARCWSTWSDVALNFSRLDRIFWGSDAGFLTVATGLGLAEIFSCDLKCADVLINKFFLFCSCNRSEVADACGATNDYPFKLNVKL